MRRRPVGIRFRATIALAVVMMSIGPPPFAAKAAFGQAGAMQEQQPYQGVDVGLEEGEMSRTTRFRALLRPTSPNGGVGVRHAEPAEFVIRNAYPVVEVGVAVSGASCPFSRIQIQDLTTAPGPGETEITTMASMRRIYTGKPQVLLRAALLTGDGAQEFVEPMGVPDKYYECVIEVTVSRAMNHCSVSAKVSGDVNGTYYGDVAYFNTYDEPQAVPLDPGTMAMLDGLLNMAVAPVKPDDEKQPQSFSEALAAFIAEDEDAADLPTLGRFHLTGSNVLFRDGDFGGAGMFSFSAIGPGEIDVDTMETDIPLTHVAVLPGAFDKAYSGIKFVWNKGEPGDAYLEIKGTLDQPMIGELTAHLYTEREYDPPGRRLQILLEATFVAWRGALACQ